MGARGRCIRYRHGMTVGTAPRAPRVPGRRREDFAVRTRARTATLNQLLLGSVVFVLGILVAIGPFSGDGVMFFIGVVVIFVLTGATLVIPWNRIPFGWVALVPAIDIIAITL